MHATRVIIRETDEGWSVPLESTVTLHPTAAAAERHVREYAEAHAPSVVLIEWEPQTRVGRMVARTIAGA